jgi:transketolase
MKEDDKTDQSKVMIDPCKNIRMNIIMMCHRTKTASMGSSLSCVEILVSIFKNKRPEDRFILSKGHASAGLYAVLAELGYINPDDLNQYCMEGSIYNVGVKG